MATRALTAPPFRSSRRVPAAVSVRDRRLSATLRPTFLQRQLAYLANGDLPPVLRAVEASAFTACGALGAFGFGLMLGSGLL